MKVLGRRFKIPARIRHVTNRLVGNIPVRIKSGQNQGRLWSLASAGAGHVAGTRCSQQLAVVQQLVRPAEIFWDVGANHGYLTLAAARQIGTAGQVHSFEPAPLNLWFLRRHVKWNRLSNVTVHPVALSSFDGQERFGGIDSSKTYSLGEGPEVVVVQTATTVVSSGMSPPPTFIKVDVEGAELDFLKGAIDMLRADCRLLVAFHSRTNYEAGTKLLAHAGYRAFASAGIRHGANHEWRHDPDVLFVGPAYHTPLSDLSTLQALLFKEVGL